MINTPKIIGFCGGSFGSNGVGKTTAANFVVKEFGFHYCSLSNAVEQSAIKLCKWDGKKDKDGLIILNQVCASGRKINENYWLNITLASIPKNVDKVVFDDVYFKNEINFIKSKDGTIINIERNGYVQPETDYYAVDLNLSYNIPNNSTIEDFQKTIRIIVTKLYNIKNAKL